MKGMLIQKQYNILDTVTVKDYHVKPVEFIILQEITDSPLGSEFVRHLIEVGTLRLSELFAVNNCAVHM